MDEEILDLKYETARGQEDDIESRNQSQRSVRRINNVGKNRLKKKLPWLHDGFAQRPFAHIESTRVVLDGAHHQGKQFRKSNLQDLHVKLERLRVEREVAQREASLELAGVLSVPHDPTSSDSVLCRVCSARLSAVVFERRTVYPNRRRIHDRRLLRLVVDLDGRHHGLFADVLHLAVAENCASSLETCAIEIRSQTLLFDLPPQVHSVKNLTRAIHQRDGVDPVHGDGAAKKRKHDM